MNSARPRDHVAPTVSLATLAARTLPSRAPTSVQQPSSTQTVPSTLVATTVTPTLMQRVKKETSVSQQRGAVNGMQQGLIQLHPTGGSLQSNAQGLGPGIVWQAAMAQM